MLGAQPFLNCRALEKGGGVFCAVDVDPVAVNLLAIHRHVAQVDAEAELHPPSGGRGAFSVLRVV